MERRRDAWLILSPIWNWIDIIPEFNLYEEFWKIYTNSDIIPPQYISGQSVIERSIIGDGSEVYGEVHNCVIGSGVTIGEGTVVKDSIIMKDVSIGKGCVIDKSIIAENCEITGDNANIWNCLAMCRTSSAGSLFLRSCNGWRELRRSRARCRSAEHCHQWRNIQRDYPNGILESGETLIKAGERA